MGSAEKEEALQDNMTLTIESARAIGCRVTDTTGDQILSKDPSTIRGFLVDLIRVSPALMLSHHGVKGLVTMPAVDIVTLGIQILLVKLTFDPATLL